MLEKFQTKEDLASRSYSLGEKLSILQKRREEKKPSIWYKIFSSLNLNRLSTVYNMIIYLLLCLFSNPILIFDELQSKYHTEYVEVIYNQHHMMDLLLIATSIIVTYALLIRFRKHLDKYMTANLLLCVLSTYSNIYKAHDMISLNYFASVFTFYNVIIVTTYNISTIWKSLYHRILAISFMISIMFVIHLFVEYIVIIKNEIEWISSNLVLYAISVLIVCALMYTSMNRYVEHYKVRIPPIKEILIDTFCINLAILACSQLDTGAAYADSISVMEIFYGYVWVITAYIIFYIAKWDIVRLTMGIFFSMPIVIFLFKSLGWQVYYAYILYLWYPVYYTCIISLLRKNALYIYIHIALNYFAVGYMNQYFYYYGMMNIYIECLTLCMLAYVFYLHLKSLRDSHESGRMLNLSLSKTYTQNIDLERKVLCKREIKEENS